MLKYILPLLITSTLFGEVTVENFQYDGHQYLIFNGTAVIHDPDCQCKDWCSDQEIIFEN